MTSAVRRALSWSLPVVASILSCDTQSDAQTTARRPDAGRAALEIIAHFEKSDIAGAALRHEATVKRFASRAATLPQAVQQKVWNDEFVAEFRRSIQHDAVGFALIGSPAMTVIETRSSRDQDQYPAATVHDVFLQLEYASIERSSMLGANGRLLKRKGLRLQLAETPSGGLLWRRWALIPDLLT